MTIANIDDFREHIAGPCICIRCGDEWIGVSMPDVINLECKSCGSMSGVRYENFLDGVKSYIGDDCCGDVDDDGICCAPACRRGETLKVVGRALRLAELEFGVSSFRGK